MYVSVKGQGKPVQCMCLSKAKASQCNVLCLLKAKASQCNVCVCQRPRQASAMYVSVKGQGKPVRYMCLSKAKASQCRWSVMYVSVKLYVPLRCV